MLPGLMLDDGPAHLCRREVVGQARGDERPGAHTDVDGNLGEVDPVEGFVQGTQRTDLVNRPLGSAPGKGKADGAGCTRGCGHLGSTPW